jgi:hypothetical protein
MMPTAVEVRIVGSSFFSTHHASALDALERRERPFTPPAFELLVGRARRFTSLVTQMHLEVAAGLPVDAAAPPLAVFATCHGEIHTAEALIADIAASAPMSSARFALSVHNTASGLYSVATGNTAAATTVTGANALAAGWLEAALTALEGRPVLLSIADEPVPAVFQGPSGTVGVAAGFLLAPASSPGRGAQLVITPCADDAAAIDPVHALAQAAAACQRDAATTVALGRIRPGGMLELRVS